MLIYIFLSFRTNRSNYKHFECYKSIYQKHGTNLHLKRTNAISKCRSLTAILCSFHCSLVCIACIFHMEFLKQHAKSTNFKTNLMWYRCIHKCARCSCTYNLFYNISFVDIINPYWCDLIHFDEREKTNDSREIASNCVCCTFLKEIYYPNSNGWTEKTRQTKRRPLIWFHR